MSVRSEVGSLIPFQRTPLIRGYRPVAKAARDGMQFGLATKTLPNETPPAARPSRFGVSITSLPFAPRVSYRCWSVYTRRTFGCTLRL